MAQSGIHNKAVGRIDIGVFKAMTFSSLIDLLSQLDAVVALLDKRIIFFC